MTQSNRYTRRELYDLVWSEPMIALAAKIGFSTTTIRNACKELQVPIPQQGYCLKMAIARNQSPAFVVSFVRPVA